MPGVNVGNLVRQPFTGKDLDVLDNATISNRSGRHQWNGSWNPTCAGSGGSNKSKKPTKVSGNATNVSVPNGDNYYIQAQIHTQQERNAAVSQWES